MRMNELLGIVSIGRAHSHVLEMLRGHIDSIARGGCDVPVGDAGLRAGAHGHDGPERQASRSTFGATAT